MKICYRVNISNPNSVSLFPPSLQTYQNNLYTVVSTSTSYFEDQTQIVQFFNGYDELTAYYNANKMTAEQEAVFTEWKTANSISITYEVFEIADTAVPHIFP